MTVELLGQAATGVSQSRTQFQPPLPRTGFRKLADVVEDHAAAHVGELAAAVDGFVDDGAPQRVGRFVVNSILLEHLRVGDFRVISCFHDQAPRAVLSNNGSAIRIGGSVRRSPRRTKSTRRGGSSAVIVSGVRPELARKMFSDNKYDTAGSDHGNPAANRKYSPSSTVVKRKLPQPSAIVDETGVP